MSSLSQSSKGHNISTGIPSLIKVKRIATKSSIFKKLFERIYLNTLWKGNRVAAKERERERERERLKCISELLMPTVVSKIQEVAIKIVNITQNYCKLLMIVKIKVLLY